RPARCFGCRPRRLEDRCDVCSCGSSSSTKAPPTRAGRSSPGARPYRRGSSALSPPSCARPRACAARAAPQPPLQSAATWLWVRGAWLPDDRVGLRRILNALTLDEVAVREMAVVDDAFDPRRHARSRVYEYRLLTAAAPSPFWRRYAWHVPRPLDPDAMDEAAG